MIHDAQYTLEEYPEKVTWGHTPAEQAVDFCLAAGAKRLALFHHDPLRKDEALDQLVEVCRAHAAAGGGGLEVFAAAEGQIIELAPRATPPGAVTEPAELPMAGTAGRRAGSPTILLVDDNPDTLRLLTMTLRSEGFRLLTASDGDTALALARAERTRLGSQAGLSAPQRAEAWRAWRDAHFEAAERARVEALLGGAD